MSKDLIITDELKGLEKSKAAQIEAVFKPMVDMLKSFERDYNEVVKLDPSEETSKVAKRLRLDIAKVRIEADKVRKVQKEEYVRGGNAVQGVYNILKFAVTDKEEHLKEIETHFDRLEAEKVKTLQAERELELIKYDVDGSVTDLGNMDNPIWINYLSGVKLNYQAVIDAEKKAEADRIEAERVSKLTRDRKDLLSPYWDFITDDHNDNYGELSEVEFQSIIKSVKIAKKFHEDEQAKIKAENDRLKKEAEEKEKKRIALEKANAEKLEKERKEQERIRIENQKKLDEEKRISDEKLKKEREESERKAAKEKAKQDAILKKEREEREKLEKEISLKKAEEEKLLKEKEIADKKALEAGDPEKLKSLLLHFDELKGGKLKSEIAQKAIKESYSILLEAIKGLEAV